MTLFKLDDTYIKFGEAFTANGVQYPANWLEHANTAEKEAIGITIIEEQTAPDSRYYYSTYNGDGTYTSVQKDANTILQSKYIDLANKRYAVETAGIVVANSTILTDRGSQAMITGAALQAVIDPTYSVRWKIPPATWVNLDANTLLYFAQTVRTHVQTCFTTEEAHQANLIALAANGTANDVMNYDFSTGWPETANTR